MKKLFLLLVVLFLSVLAYCDVFSGEKQIILSENNEYNISWTGNILVLNYFVKVQEVVFMNEKPCLGKVVYESVSHGNKTEIPVNVLNIGQEYVLTATPDRSGYNEEYVYFYVQGDVEAVVPRTEKLIPRIKNPEIEKMKENPDYQVREVANTLPKYVYSDEVDFKVKCKLYPEMFSKPGNEYNGDLALLSVAGAGVSYNYNFDEDINKYLKEFMNTAGFSHVEYFNGEKNVYEKEKSDVVFYAIGHRIINVNNKTYNLISIVVRGTILGEWFSNFNIGEGDYHKGFLLATEDILKNLDNYVKKYDLTDKSKNKYWICGHSRGAAVTNLLSDFMMNLDYVDPTQIYAYAFATPNVTVKSECDSNCFNFINSRDFVPCIPYWTGWKKYGKEINSKDFSLKTLKETKKVFKDITSYNYAEFSEKEMNIIISELNRLAPNVDSFYNLKYNTSAKDGGKSTYECCNILCKSALELKFKGMLSIPNDFKRLFRIFAITNAVQPKILLAHSIEYYYSLVDSYNKSLEEENKIQ